MLGAFLNNLCLDILYSYTVSCAYSLRKLKSTNIFSCRVRTSNTKIGNVMNGSPVITNIVTSGLLIDSYVIGSGILEDSKIITIDSNTITINKNVIADGTGITLKFEKDIGFSGIGLDISGLLEFCGSNNGYITKCYDKSENGNHIIQSIESKQPQIVNNGALIIDANGNPSMLFSSIANSLLSCVYNSSFDITENITIMIVHQPIDLGGGGLGRIVSKNDLTDYAFYLGTNNVCRMSTLITSDNNAFVLNSVNLNSVIFTNNSNASFHLNGLSWGIDETVSSIAAGNNSLNVGNRSTSSRGYNGYISEVIIFPSALPSKKRHMIEVNQGKFYNIGVGYST